MTEKNFTNNDTAFALEKAVTNITESDSFAKCNVSATLWSKTAHAPDSYGSRVSGQHLAGSGALVFEGELLEFPLWGAQAA